MQRIKLNENIETTPKYPTKTSLYNTFNKEFNYFTNVLIKDAYVRRPPDESTIREIINDDRSCFFFIEGFTGTGKSTLLQNILSPDVSESLAPNVLKVYFSLNPGSIPSLNDFIIRFTSMIAEEGRKFALNLPTERQRLIFDKEKFYSFVISHKRYSELKNDALFPPNNRLKDSVDELLSDNIETPRPPLIVLWLEYILLSVDNNARCLLVVDDIEGVKCNLQSEILNYVVSAYAGLATDFASSYNYSVLVFFPIRPDTLCHMMSSKDTLKIDAFKAEIIPLNIPPALKEIFLARFQNIQNVLKAQNIEDTQDKRQNSSRYRNVYENVLIPILDKLSFYTISNRSLTSYMDIFMELSNYNIRNALDLIRMLLVNGDYFEKKNDSYSNSLGEVSLDSYFTTDAGILFSIAIQSGNIYLNLPPVVNILKNKKESNSEDILPSLLIRFMLNAIQHDELYAPYSKKKIKQEIKDILNLFYSDDNIDEIYNYFIKKEIFLMSYGTQNDDHFILAPRGRILWKMASQTSILMQCYREDLYRNEDEQYLTMKFTDKMSRDMVYLDILSYLDNLLKAEIDLIEIIKDNSSIEEFIKKFGSKLTSRHLFEGVYIGYKKYFQNESRISSELKSSVDNLNKELETVEGYIEEISKDITENQLC